MIRAICHVLQPASVKLFINNCWLLITKCLINLIFLEILLNAFHLMIIYKRGFPNAQPFTLHDDKKYMDNKWLIMLYFVVRIFWASLYHVEICWNQVQIWRHTKRDKPTRMHTTTDRNTYRQIGMKYAYATVAGLLWTQRLWCGRGKVWWDLSALWN